MDLPSPKGSPARSRRLPVRTRNIARLLMPAPAIPCVMDSRSATHPPDDRDALRTGGSANITVRSLSTPDPGCHRAVQQRQRRPRCGVAVPGPVRHAVRRARPPLVNAATGACGRQLQDRATTGSLRTGHGTPIHCHRWSVSQADVVPAPVACDDWLPKMVFTRRICAGAAGPRCRRGGQLHAAAHPGNGEVQRGGRHRRPGTLSDAKPLLFSALPGGRAESGRYGTVSGGP